MIIDKAASKTADSDIPQPTSGPPNQTAADGEPTATASAQVAVEQSITAEVIVKIAAAAAERAMTRAKETADAAVNAAFQAAAEVVAEASAVAEARVIAAAAAAKAAERMRQSFAGVIDAELDANLVLAQIAKTLSEELAAHKETEAQLLEREAELTAFAGMVAHDLKAPLRSVSGFTTMLFSDLTEAAPGGLDASILDKMDRILAATERMRRLVDDQLTFVTARERTLNLESVDLGAMITEITTDLRSSPGSD